MAMTTSDYKERIAKQFLTELSNLFLSLTDESEREKASALM